ncbi:ATP-dependent zinc metalloprotease FtsH [candidate division KSB1 bacterium]
MDRKLPKKQKGGIKFRKKSNGDDNRQKKNYQNKNSDQQWRKGGRTIFVWAMFFLIMFFIYNMLESLKEVGEYEVDYKEHYLKFLEEGKIASAEIVDNVFRGVLFAEEDIILNGNPVKVTRFSVILPDFYKEMEDEWRAQNINYTFRKPEFAWSSMFITIFPWVLIFGVWIYFLRRMQSGGGSRGIFSFGKSKAKLLIENKPKITFKDVAGTDEAKVELQEIIEFLQSPGKFQKLGGKIPKGALLIGPPGTGKTLLARAVAGEAEVPFFSISGADFVEMFVGVGASRVRDLFEQAKKNSPCIIFIDEIDAVGRTRGAGLGGGHDEREQTLNQLLVEMDGFEHNEGVILLAATNRPDVLDNALLRPGRFDRQIVVDRPDVRGREGIFRVHSKDIPLDASVDLEILAKGTPGLAGADIANIVNEAALLAARDNKEKVDMDDFEQAKDKVMMGIERKTLIISEDEKKNTAYHEAGHVLASILTPGSDPIHKVTIIPRGRALGVTTSLPIDERHTYSKTYCESILIKMMGGRCAEKIVFNTLSTGAGNDLEQATNLARKMVCEWGMSEEVGPLTFGKKDEEIFLGRDFATQRNFSEKTAQIIDEEIKKIVIDAEKQTDKLLKENINTLHKLSEALLKYEILDSKQIEDIVNGKKIKSQKRRYKQKISDDEKGKKTSNKPKKKPQESDLKKADKTQTSKTKANKQKNNLDDLNNSDVKKN